MDFLKIKLKLFHYIEYKYIWETRLLKSTYQGAMF